MLLRRGCFLDGQMEHNEEAKTLTFDGLFCGEYCYFSFAKLVKFFS